MTKTVHAPFIELLAQLIVSAKSKDEQIAISHRCPLKDLPALRKILVSMPVKLKTSIFPYIIAITKQVRGRALQSMQTKYLA